MAIETKKSLRNLVFYQIFVRQFSKTHDFKGVIEKLDELKSLNIDVIQLLPIHPIGIDHRKGSVGSPYSIIDYYEVNKDYGNEDDFKMLLDECHKRNMKVVLDIVFNHTSHDSTYSKIHPEWFCHKEDGSFCNRVGDWWDIIDFDFTNNEALENELIDVLVYWTKKGVDGYRCDVAPLLPLTFWQKAKKAIKAINKDIILISESVHLGFIKYLRDLGYEACSDSEILQVFDICYDYDIYDDLINYLKGISPLSKWTDNLYRQEAIYPSNYVKLRYLENHDMDRIALNCKNDDILRNITAMQFFLKGCPFIYNGQECACKNRPNLFEIDEIDWSEYNKVGLVDIIKELIKLRKEYDFINGIFDVKCLDEDVVLIKYQKDNNMFTGLFNLGETKQIEYPCKGYSYLDKKEIDFDKILLKDPLIVISRIKNE